MPDQHREVRVRAAAAHYVEIFAEGLPAGARRLIAVRRIDEPRSTTGDRRGRTPAAMARALRRVFAAFELNIRK
jgi:hypothetical protein